MSLTDVEAEILGPMQQLYLPPRNYDESQQREALKQYGAALQSFDATDLREAWGSVRDSHTTRAWPVPAAFVLAARGARKARGLSQPTRFRERQSWERPSKEEAWQNWLKIRVSPTAQRAAREGWLWSLRCSVLDGSIEQEGQANVLQFQSSHRSVQQNADRLEREGVMVRPDTGEVVKFSPENREIALKLWHTMLENAARVE